MLDLRPSATTPSPCAGPWRAARPRAVENLDRALRLDEERLALLARVEEARAEKNRLSKAVGRARATTSAARTSRRSAALSEGLDKLQAELDRVTEELHAVAVLLPNPPHESVPEGASDDDNEELKRWGEPPSFAFDAARPRRARADCSA